MTVTITHDIPMDLRVQLRSKIMDMRIFCHSDGCLEPLQCPAQGDHKLECRKRLGLNTGIVWFSAEYGSDLLSGARSARYVVAVLYAYLAVLDLHYGDYHYEHRMVSDMEDIIYKIIHPGMVSC